MSADHNTLDALRRLAKDRAATPAEKATARRLAMALVAKIGNRPRRGRRKDHGAALPEPPTARRRRLWIVWLEGALNKIEVAWWLRIVPGERLRSARAWSANTLPPIALMGAAMTAGAMIEYKVTGRSIL